MFKTLLTWRHWNKASSRHRSWAKYHTAKWKPPPSRVLSKIAGSTSKIMLVLLPRKSSRIWKCDISSYRVNDSWNIDIESNTLMCLCRRNRGLRKIAIGIWACWSQRRRAMLTWCSSWRGQPFKQAQDLASMRLVLITLTLVKFIIQLRTLGGKTSISIGNYQDGATSFAAHLHHPWPFEISMRFPNASDTINLIWTICQETLRIA